ncbi:MAG: aminotransferase class IV [Pirellulaceae bacterium]
MDRLLGGLEIVGVSLPWSREQLMAWAEEVASTNHRLLAEGDDLALVVFVTPGPYAAFAAAPGIVPDGERGPLLVMHSYPLPFANWAKLYEQGQPLVISNHREVPTSCWPASLKCRSRMHYYLADAEARRVDPQARAILLDTEGMVAEASTASLFLWFEEEGFVAPPVDQILPSISLGTIREMAAKMGHRFSHREIEAAELFDADEVLLCSTSPCVLAGSVIDGLPVGAECPGRMWRTLIRGWNEIAGFDLVEQAERFRVR